MDTTEQTNELPPKQTAFRRSEKMYKSWSTRLVDFTNIVDLLVQNSGLDDNNNTVRRVQLTRDLETPTGLHFQAFRHKRPPAYVLGSHPDLIVIPDVLTDEAQRWLARKCLCDCAHPPNRTNLDPFFELPAESLFSISAYRPRDRNSMLLRDQTELIQCRAQHNNIDTGVTVPKDKFYLQPASAEDLLERLRWCTLGKQYNWTTKEYDLGASPFDVEIDGLMKSIAIATTQPENNSNDDRLPCANNYEGSNYVSQAGIINYYDERSTMAGHVDKTEENMDAPLISLSIGLSCVYLIGGNTRDIEPTGLLLRSGDVLVMCGESRLAFHGVPRIIAGSSPKYLIDPSAGSCDTVNPNYPEWSHFARYLATHRVNCNARKCS
ncbi:hypothetical protein IW140_000674 [Coemansia sp. RSA 1813]|nr:hypothetical protein EV178_000821 [Coemansia sp. RSA 1646]KAJ1773853.1 hypothetical protein LPJ74_000397 [Coemansia sp. RSA 1843]KAJ2092441.1 hypothetical protein IW138_001203 [Coemansia sp. RSA 986]KAJ2217335.1 hypothetical protein EV179_000485 [Coemansia sp. RSA 487]KAJ2572559.1 hypothetical protein IW140_000674 [Coemansia sp. RSA 1813]